MNPVSKLVNPSLKKLVSLILITFLLAPSLVADAKIKASEVEFVSGENEELKLFVLDKDLDIDLDSENSSLRMLMDTKDLLVKKSYPQSFQVRTYSFGINGEQMFHSTINHTVRRRNRTKVRFVVELGYAEGDKDYYFELYDSAGRLVNTYRQGIDFSNLEDQVANLTPIASSTCDGSSFNECHLDYIMDKINFLLEPKNTNFSNKIKRADGAYDVVISVPKSVKEQILSGNFNISSSGNNSNNSSSNGDNLGNHIAFMNLNMNQNDIINVETISAAKFNGTDLSVSGLATFGSSITIPTGAAEGYVLSSDANGKASWTSLGVISNGDNLGNHIATQDLHMNSHNIDNAGTLDAEAIVVNGAFAIKTGASNGFVLTSDNNGNASWMALQSVVNGDGLGNHTAVQNLNMANNSILAANMINADILSAMILDVTTIDVGAQIHSPSLHGAIDLNGHTLVTGSMNFEQGGLLDLNGADLTGAEHVATKALFSDTSTALANLANGGTNIAIDWSQSNKYVVALNANTNISFNGDPMGTADLTLVIKQDGVGGHSVTLPISGNIKWPHGNTPQISNGAGMTDLIDCYFDGLGAEYLCNRREASYQ